MSSNREIPQRLVVADQINGSDVVISSTGAEYFDSVTPQGTGNIHFFGGVFEYVDIDAANATNVVKYINPDTGEAFPAVTDDSAGDLANGKPAGWYEKVPSEPVVINVPAGIPVYGRFEKVTLPSGADTTSVLITKG